MDLKFGISAAGSTSALPQPSRVEVRERLGEMISFTVIYSEDVYNGDFALLMRSEFAPCKEIEIWVEADKTKQWLIKGPVCSHLIKLVDGGQDSELQIRGADNSIKMKQSEQFQNHANSTDKDIAASIIGNYFSTTVIDDDGLTNDEAQHSRIQNQDDLTFIKGLARENGMYFWIGYDESGEEVANFDVLPSEDDPSATLIINASDKDKNNNIDQLMINWDVDVPTQIVGKQMNPLNKNKEDASVDKAPQGKLGATTLTDLTSEWNQQSKTTTRPSDYAGRSRKRGEGALNDAEWFIHANCSTSFDRLNSIIHAHTIVEILGAGSRHSGKYMVSGVVHTIDASSYKMQLELIRNAWDS